MTIYQQKTIWFVRWIAMCYEGLLNEQTGDWYEEQYKYFSKEVYPKWLKASKGDVKGSNAPKFIWRPKTTRKIKYIPIKDTLTKK